MFNKKDNAPGRKTPPFPTPKPIGKVMSNQHAAPSILSGDLAVTGSISSEGEIQLDGNVEGDIRAMSITIGEKSVIKGEVVADTIIVRGKVTGKVRGRQVQLAATARVEGDITHSTLSMENGAFFEGQCRHASDPTTTSRKAAPKATPAAKTTVAPPQTAASRVAPPVMGGKK